MSGLDDRTVTLDAPEQLAGLGAVLGSRTRLAVLGVLVRASEPMNINEIARRVGVDASPVRMHLEILLKEGLVKELDAAGGRGRRFETPLTGVRLVLEDVRKDKRPPHELPKPAARIQRKIEALARDIEKLETKARRYRDELTKATSAAAARP